MVVRLPWRLASCVSSCCRPRKKELPSMVTLPLMMSSRMMEEAQLELLTAFGIIYDCENPAYHGKYLRWRLRWPEGGPK
jgi:hypothetical protein